MRKINTTIITILLMIIKLSAQIDSEIQPYYDAFISDAALKGVDLSDRYSISAKFSFRNMKAMGESKVDSDDKHAILLINRFSWDTLTITEKKILIYHELGHALLFRPHQDYSLSIMNSNMISESDYLNNESDVINELFLPYDFSHIQFKPPTGKWSDPLSLNKYDLILVLDDLGKPLKPYMINEQNNPIYGLIKYYDIYVLSVIDFRDTSKMVIKGNRIVQINSTHGGVSLVQPNWYKQPIWDDHIMCVDDDHLVFHYDGFNTSFDSTPFRQASGASVSLSGDVRFDETIFNVANRLIVISTKKIML